MTIDIEDLRAKLDAATPGPWEYRETLLGLPNTTINAGDGQVGYVAVGSFLPHDASAIVAAVNALPALLDELERLRAKTPETEWEYIVRYWDDGRGTDVYVARSEEDARRIVAETPHSDLLRRVKAGPWLPVEEKNP